MNSESEFKNAYCGITQDLSGYAGSKDWTRFYSYIYMTGAYGTEKGFETALGMHGTAGSWKTIVVTGPGNRRVSRGITVDGQTPTVRDDSALS